MVKTMRKTGKNFDFPTKDQIKHVFSLLWREFKRLGVVTFSTVSVALSDMGIYLPNENITLTRVEMEGGKKPVAAMVIIHTDRIAFKIGYETYYDDVNRKFKLRWFYVVERW